MEYRAIYQKLERSLLHDRHPHAPNYTLVLLLAEIFIWVAILCFILAALSFMVGLLVACFKFHFAPIVAGFLLAIQFLIGGVFNLCTSQLIHAYRDIARNGFKQNALLEKLTGEPTEKQRESAAALPDLAPVPKPNASQDPRNPPPHWVPGTPRGWTVTGLDVNGMQFHLSYLWVTQEQAVNYAKAEGIVMIQEIQPIRD